MRFLAPRWLLSHVFVVAMVVIMVNLGFWQLRRLDERQERNDEVRDAIERAPVAIEDLLEESPPPPDQTPVIVEGAFRPDLEFLVANRTYEGTPGSWLVTPIELADGRLVVVARGWVPRLWVAGADPRDASAPTGAVTVEGRSFASVDGGRTAGTPTGDLPELSRLDLEQVEELLGVAVVDRWVQLADQSPAAGDLPVPVPPPGLDEGPHLSYAFQWFFFSTGTVIAYALILRRRAREPAPVGGREGSTPETVVLLATRLKGRGTAAEVRESSAGLAGGRSTDLDEAMATAVADGLIRVRGVDLRHSLTPAGEVRLAELLAVEADDVGAEALAEVHERFLPVNRRFLEAVSAWQLEGDTRARDRIGALVAELGPSLDRLAERLPRFRGYPDRFSRALQEATDDPRWFDAPLIDSVHTIWFELHEHLLASLGRTREQERSG